MSFPVRRPVHTLGHAKRFESAVSRAVAVALHAYWGEPAELPRDLRRRYEVERKYRLGCLNRGCVPDDGDWEIREIRSGQWERRTKRNDRNIRRDQAKLAQWKRDGYSFDAEHRLVAPPSPSSRATARPREHRARRRTTTRATRAGASRDGPGEPEPEPPDDLAVMPPAEFRRQLRALGVSP